jgi:alkylated DNA repair dioxygenase AlkB
MIYLIMENIGFIDKNIYNTDKCNDIFLFLDNLEVEYHKEYKRFNKVRKVPRGQASFTFDENIHYNYKVAGGSPPNKVMCDTLKQITLDVNKYLNTNFNTILLNTYQSGFATLAFGEERDFQIKNEKTQKVTNILHKNGNVIYLPFPMNSLYLHSIPKRKRKNKCRISLTFREIRQ